MNAVTADAAVKTTTTVSMNGGVTDLTFYLWIIVPLLTVFMASQYATIRDRFYVNHIKSRIRPFMIMIYMMITDIMMAISLTYYLWNTQNPPLGEETDWFISLFSLWFIIQAMKAAWSLLFWTYGSELLALGASLVIAVITDACCFLLACLFFVRSSYVSGSLALVVAVLYIALCVFTGIVVYRTWRHKRRVSRKRRDEYMVMRPQQQQQYPGQQPEYYTY